MKIAIHHRKNSFSDRWLAYCQKNNIKIKIVDAYQSNIIQQVEDCDAFMWHFSHNNEKDTLFAKQLLFALESAGKIIYPSTNLAWHFDDKVAQKYVLEGIGAPLIESEVFYSKKDALEWLEEINFPIVFKLRRGAGSQNVRLIKTKKNAEKLIKKAFSKGFSQYNSIGVLKDRYQKYKNGNDTFIGVIKGVIRLIYPTRFSKIKGKERGYIYFQKFLPNNTSDTRVIIVGNRAFAVKRMVRENDFRASGSGIKKYNREEIDEKTIKIAFSVAKKLDLNCIGFDFVFDHNNNPFIVEMGFGFAIQFYDPCPGYWDEKLNWHEGKFIPQEWMIEDLLLLIKEKNE